jgi:hypothetical protein
VRTLVLITLALAAVAAPAQAATVAIVRPANPPPLIVETLVHLHGELTSMGFATEIVDEPAVPGAGGRPSRAWLEQLGALRSVDAIVALVGDVPPDAVELWGVDKVTGKSVVRRVPYEPRSERAPKTLAIRAIELLRSSFLEIDLAMNERRNEPTAVAPPPAVVRFVERERLARRPERFGVEVGGAAVMSLDGVGPALLPLLRFDWSPRPWFVMQLAVAGLGTRSTVETRTGSAQLAQEYLVLGAGYRFLAGQRLRPFLALAAGALHTSVDGRAVDSPPNQGHHAQQWSLLLDGAVGAHLHLRDRFYLSLAAHAQMAEPYVAVRFVDTIVASAARPNLLATLTIGAWL